MDEININVLRELQEYAQLYFESIVELNTINGKCTLKPGKYSAKDMQDNSHKSVFGHSYPLPEDSIYDEVLTIKCGTFECEFPYRRIFTILTRWETMCKAGKLKAVFEIGEFEEKSAKVLINDRTMLGSFKTKTMKLQRIAGNWWGLPKEIRKENGVTGYYELNGVMFAPGKTFYGNPRDDANKAFTDKFDDAKISELLIKYISDESHKECDIYEYYIEAMKRAGVHQPATPTETPRISTETADTVNVSTEGEDAENESIKHISEIMETCRTWDDEKRDYTDEYKYYTWLANHIPEHKATNKNTTELILEGVRERISAAATLAAHGVPKCDIGGAVYAVVNRLAKMEDILQFYSRTEPSQSPETPQTPNYTTELEKRDTELRNKPKRRVRRFRTTRSRTIKSSLIVGCVPRKRSTTYHFCEVAETVVTTPGYTPPIRGDCKIRRSIRAKPPYFSKTYQINYFKPP